MLISTITTEGHSGKTTGDSGTETHTVDISTLTDNYKKLTSSDFILCIRKASANKTNVADTGSRWASLYTEHSYNQNTGILTIEAKWSAGIQMSINSTEIDIYSTLAPKVEIENRGVDYNIIDYQFKTSSNSSDSEEFTFTIPEDGYYIFATGCRIKTPTETLTTNCEVLNTLTNENTSTTSSGSTVYQKNRIYLIRGIQGQSFTYKTKFGALIKINSTTVTLTSLLQYKSTANGINYSLFEYENISNKPVLILCSGISGYNTTMPIWEYVDHDRPVLVNNLINTLAADKADMTYGICQILQVDPYSKVSAVLCTHPYSANEVALITY